MTIPYPDLSDIGTCMCGHFDDGCDACREVERRVDEYNRKRGAQVDFDAAMTIPRDALRDPVGDAFLAMLRGRTR